MRAEDNGRGNLITKNAGVSTATRTGIRVMAIKEGIPELVITYKEKNNYGNTKSLFKEPKRRIIGRRRQHIK